MRRQSILVTAVICGAISVCMLGLADPMPGAGHALLLAVGLAALVLTAAVVREGRRHHRLAADLSRLARRAMLDGHPVELVPGLGGAVVVGLRHPRIYCADDLAVRLAPEELRAVLLHERHHELERAPARLVLLGGLGTLAGRVDVMRDWLERERARLEIAADSFALASGASRPALASALVKLSPTAGLSPAPGFASAAELRLRALLGETIGIEREGSTGGLALALVAVVSCVALYLW